MIVASDRDRMAQYIADKQAKAISKPLARMEIILRKATMMNWELIFRALKPIPNPSCHKMMLKSDTNPTLPHLTLFLCYPPESYSCAYEIDPLIVAW